MRGGRGGVGMFSSMSSMFGNNSLKYYCMSCGTKDRETACPKCGSKMKRVGS
jgi:rubrerythrin